MQTGKQTRRPTHVRHTHVVATYGRTHIRPRPIKASGAAGPGPRKCICPSWVLVESEHFDHFGNILQGVLLEWIPCEACKVRQRIHTCARQQGWGPTIVRHTPHTTQEPEQSYAECVLSLLLMCSLVPTPIPHQTSKSSNTKIHPSLSVTRT
jgi:hypothetical protein